MNVLMFPICGSLYRVGPQTYIPTMSLCMGTKASLFPDKVLNIKSCFLLELFILLAEVIANVEKPP